jgi:hypothetical protein
VLVEGRLVFEMLIICRAVMVILSNWVPTSLGFLGFRKVHLEHVECVNVAVDVDIHAGSLREGYIAYRAGEASNITRNQYSHIGIGIGNAVYDEKVAIT